MGSHAAYRIHVSILDRSAGAAGTTIALSFAGASRSGYSGNFFHFRVFERYALAFEQKGLQMLHYALVFFVVALIAAVFGFGGIAAGAAEIAKILFFIFLILFVVSLVTGLFRRGQ
jgi:uncharacterized membrane protein YtjA (UPF0391 family)